jgi:hypothetical protein
VCLSVGANFTSTANPTPVVEALSGRKWKSVSVKLPKGAEGAALDGVSCKSRAYCLAVGAYYTGAGGSLAYALTWNGTALTPVAAPPVPKGDTLLELSAVSCAAVRSCVVVGTSVSSGVSSTGTDTFTDTWNGAKWTEVTTPTKGASLDEFIALHCFSAKACVAAGNAYSDTGASTVLVATWNGKTWTPQKAVTPKTPAGLTVTVSDLSCVSAKSCALAGVSLSSAGTGGFGFLEVLNGKTWSEVKWTAPKGDTLTVALGVSCASASNCVAAGGPARRRPVAPPPCPGTARSGRRWPCRRPPRLLVRFLGRELPEERRLRRDRRGRQHERDQDQPAGGLLERQVLDAGFRIKASKPSH